MDTNIIMEEPEEDSLDDESSEEEEKLFGHTLRNRGKRGNDSVLSDASSNGRSGSTTSRLKKMNSILGRM